MIERLEISDGNNDHNAVILLKSKINLDRKIPTPEVVVGVGTYIYKGKIYKRPTMTAGEFSAIVGSSKSGKSAFKSALVASYIGGNFPDYFKQIRGNRKDNFGIIDIDSEQSDYYAQRTFRRSTAMVGANYDNYHCFALRRYNPSQRLNFIEFLLKNKIVDNLKILFIDGIADLIDDENDLIQSKYVVGKFMEWTDKYNIHICTIIHTAYGIAKPTGHLGSTIAKKCETVFQLEREENSTKVSSMYTRGIPFEPFHFTINENDMAVEVGNFEAITINDNTSNDTPF